METTPKLTPEQSKALHLAGDVLPILDPETNKLYVVIEKSMHEQARSAFDRQQADIAAIKEGVEQFKSGKVMTIEEAQQKIRGEFKSRYDS